MENEKDIIEVEVAEDEVEVLNENGEPAVDTKKPNIFKRAWNGAKEFPKKHPKITAAVIAAGAGVAGYILGQKFKTHDDEGNDDDYDKLELFENLDCYDDETKDEEFSFTEVDDEEEAV